MVINNNYNDINENDNENTIIIDFQVLILLSLAFFISTIYFNYNSNIIDYI